MTLSVAILDMQPIDPPTGGGRLRLLGLYHDLGDDVKAQYVGTYDWPGPCFRRQFLSPTLEEVLVPLSAAHFAAAEARAQTVGGRAVIDSTFHELAHLSPDYVAAARDAAISADVVVFSHPWIYPLVRDALDPSRQLIVYDAHNVEGMLRMELLDDGGAGTGIVRGVVALEYELCHAVNLILACSHEDRRAFARLYNVPHDRIRVAPNGAFTERLKPLSESERTAIRQKLGLDERSIALFIGSDYAPNIEAARYIADELTPRFSNILFVVAGSVGDRLASRRPPNLLITGLIDEDRKRDWLQAADIAINPMFSGSGTNIKMLDYMAAGLPIIATPTGARGIATSCEAFLIADKSNFVMSLEALLSNPHRRHALAEAAREQATTLYSWERVSRTTGQLLTRRAQRNGHEAPFFSVVVPTYERHAQLTRLIEHLVQQQWRNFELIVVDQSRELWPDRSRDFGIDICYIHTDLRGAVNARNSGASLACAPVIAFIDDDCEPSEAWLAAARTEFEAPDIAGLEGLIISDHIGDPAWRPVTNDGFEGIGFMTANLFLRAEIFHAIDGFDIGCDNPHFREDTDIGWRAQEFGAIPFSHKAWVLHPAQPRAIERESLATRARFFEKDALLLRKHPRRYLELMKMECQWKQNPHFWTYFLQGAKHHQVTIPDEIRALMPPHIPPVP
jgi:glycosyltransferase involved in cell wall biosynthesis/GT2 family glycosyltransferase